MKINRKTHLELRLQNLLFTLLFLAVVGLVGWLSTRYTAQFDWTASHRHTLSEGSRKVLDLLPGPVTITAYARETPQLRERIADQVGRYRRFKPDLTLDFVNPDTQPDKVRELGISMDGELIVEYQGRTEKIQEPAETSLTNALQRLATPEERHVVFLEGHGERSPQGEANHDLGQFGDELRRKGLVVSLLNLAITPDIPDNTDVLVLAGPRVDLLPGELKQLEAYVQKGGNLLWLVDPGEQHGLQGLAAQLGLSFLPGVVVDASTQVLGIDDPTFALVAEYPPSPITQGFEEMTVFPIATALVAKEDGEFEKEAFLSTLPRSWTESGEVKGKVVFEPAKGERSGPLDIGYTLTRQVQPPAPPKPESPAQSEPPAKAEAPTPATSKKPVKPETAPKPAAKPEAAQPREAAKPAEAPKAPPAPPINQRIVVVGDGDFLSNAYLGNGGNLDLGLNLVQWLGRSDNLINIPAKVAPDSKLDLAPLASGAIAVGFLFILPLILIGTGATIWFKRRRR
ncbi:ABC-type uncharacterized transport system involved in gliding motility, auxiliary component [Methylomagnum ishizawai]|uniref:ABC-type uncharacterized transport system involved in gliding motility, auxiliary component n=1 Tax=Methylomagnum ishizawai TaxID=1760988 RepID=A0A1Y6D2Q8_9GAMM|nr:DUF4350 domain-containing protein [Methylomagnum ishizawai]SMF96876.1 ABC-type uncharacterized transport system involved in gliding motility, auxiliary component [Methylomagnum ishizawai]